jgi:hypothetical protein
LELGHLFTRSGFTLLEVALMASLGFFFLLPVDVSLFLLIYEKIFIYESCFGDNYSSYFL